MSTITMSQFGKYGRFGNQLFEYAFLKVYARQHDADLQLPPWVGNALFGANEPPVDVVLPPFSEAHTGQNWTHTQPPRGNELVNRDFEGYAQYHTSYLSPHKEYVRDLFSPATAVQERMQDVPAALRSRGDTVVAIHLRRGDYGRQIFYITPVQWYLEKLAQLWPTLDNPVLFVATEDRSLVDAFSDYSPLTTDDLGVKLNAEELPEYEYLSLDRTVREPWQLDFFPDFYTLCLCDHLLMPNSTFSFFAAMLNTTLKACWRSDLATQTFERIDPWNARPLTYDVAEDYKHIEGVCLEENPYW